MPQAALPRLRHHQLTVTAEPRQDLLLADQIATNRLGRAWHACTLLRRRRSARRVERRLSQEMTHPIFLYRASYRRVIELQARLLGRHLLGELAAFPQVVTR